MSFRKFGSLSIFLTKKHLTIIFLNITGTDETRCSNFNKNCFSPHAVGILKFSDYICKSCSFDSDSVRVNDKFSFGFSIQYCPGKYLRIILDHMPGGSLIEVLKTVGKTRIRTSDLLKYACQITSALKYLRHVHVLHRDIAARNILLNENFSTAKLADFGLAVTVEGWFFVFKKKSFLPNCIFLILLDF